MHIKILEKYIYSKLSTEKIEFKNKRDIDMIKDCFQVVAKNIKQQECIVFLIDTMKTIVVAFDSENNIKSNNLENKIIDLQFDKTLINQKLTSSFTSSGEKHDVFLYIYKTDNLINSNYYLCILSNTESDQQYIEILRNTNCNMYNIIKLLNKYTNTSDNIIIKALDSVNEGISFCDKDGYLRYINKSGCKILNYNKEELLNIRVDKHAKTRPLLLEVIESNKNFIDAEYLLRYRKNNVHLITSGYVVSDDNNNIVGAIDIFRNIERTRKLANTIAGYQAFFTFEDIIGKNNKIIENIQLAKIYAQNSENILIQGDSGTGKELFAQSIHNYSTRKNQPFVALNCANFPNELIDSELFGYEGGAFTGALKNGKPGKFELANGGTLFLDEIGEMQIHLQSKLLRVIETMCINRIGGNDLIKVNVRIIAATNRKLENLVHEGKFRKDLYYRLKVLCLNIPPLKERGSDVLLLAYHFIQKLKVKTHRNVTGLSEDTKEILLNHDWPGNIRELENTISRALYICDSNYITLKTLLMAGMKDANYEKIIKKNTIKISKKIIIDTLTLTDGNKKKASEILGISRPTLYKLIKKHNI